MEVQLIGSSRYSSNLTPAAHTATIMSQSFRDTMTAAIQSSTAKGADADTQKLYAQLSQDAKDILARIKRDEKILSEDWTKLATELRDLGAITQDEFERSSAQHLFIPVSYTDAQGRTIKYPTNPILVDRLREYSENGFDPDKAYEAGTAFDWEGDLLDYLDSWIERLRGWRTELSCRRTEYGTAYDTTSITKNINACQKTSELIRKLLRCS